MRRLGRAGEAASPAVSHRMRLWLLAVHMQGEAVLAHYNLVSNRARTEQAESQPWRGDLPRRMYWEGSGRAGSPSWYAPALAAPRLAIVLLSPAAFTPAKLESQEDDKNAMEVFPGYPDASLGRDLFALCICSEAWL